MRNPQLVMTMIFKELSSKFGYKFDFKDRTSVYAILGPKKQVVKIENTAETQKFLMEFVKEDSSNTFLENGKSDNDRIVLFVPLYSTNPGYVTYHLYREMEDKSKVYASILSLPTDKNEILKNFFNFIKESNGTSV